MDTKKLSLASFCGMWQHFSDSLYPFFVHCSTFENPRKENDFHFHDHPQLFYCLKGNYIFRFKDSSYNCAEGSLVIIPPGCSHDYIIEKNCSCTIAFINVMLNFFDNFSEEKQLRAITHLFLPAFSDSIGFHPELYISLQGEAKKQADALITKLASLNYRRRLAIIHEIQQSFCNIFMHKEFKLHKKAVTAAKNFLIHKYIPVTKSIYYININYNKHIHSNDLLAISNMCQTDYFRLIKKILNCTFSTYQQLLRVSHAIILCSFSNYTFSYISDICGFCNLSYMENRMKKFNISPPRGMQKRRSQYIEKYPEMIKSRSEYENTLPLFYAFGLK
ncbi:MAG: AraC family transcriptional regulator [Ruminococcaceae bacterium]|nr:AraC family transcriptional regulator [Oscillospiraceae bacterium]